MNQLVPTEQSKARGLTAVMAQRFEMEPAAFVGAIKQTVIKGNANDAQVAAFLMVAHQYNLNPLTKEIYAFPSNGGIQPIVSIDGWMKLINSHPQFDGMEFEDRIDDQGSLASVTCRIYRKDRSRPTEATEYMAECQRGTDPWKKWPRRMLRHKAAIQCARYAFSFAMMDEDEFDRMRDISPSDRPSVADRFATTQPQITHDEGFNQAHVEAEVSAVIEDQPVSETMPDQQPQSDVPPSSDTEPSDPSSPDQGSAEGGDSGSGESPPSPLVQYAGYLARMLQNFIDDGSVTDKDGCKDAINIAYREATDEAGGGVLTNVSDTVMKKAKSFTGWALDVVDEKKSALQFRSKVCEVANCRPEDLEPQA